jgi:hypothetical protein
MTEPIQGPCVVCGRTVAHNGKQFLCPRRHTHPEKISPSPTSSASPPNQRRKRDGA